MIDFKCWTNPSSTGRLMTQTWLPLLVHLVIFFQTDCAAKNTSYCLVLEYYSAWRTQFSVVSSEVWSRDILLLWRYCATCIYMCVRQTHSMYRHDSREYRDPDMSQEVSCKMCGGKTKINFHVFIRVQQKVHVCVSGPVCVFCLCCMHSSNPLLKLATAQYRHRLPF